MPNQEFIDRRSVDRGLAEWKDSTTSALNDSVTRMGVIEASLGNHTKMLEQNSALSICLNERFDNFETELKVERRSKDAELAKALDTWKSFTILKFDESAARQGVLETNQSQHMKSTADLQAGIGEVLGIVTALSSAKKTLGWFGRMALWIGGLAGAWIAIRTAFTASSKTGWPW